jgi:hypothetical protein
LLAAFSLRYAARGAARATQLLRQAGKHGQVGVKCDLRQSANAERRQPVLMIQAAKLALDGSAAPLEVAPPFRLPRAELSVEAALVLAPVECSRLRCDAASAAGSGSAQLCSCVRTPRKVRALRLGEPTPAALLDSAATVVVLETPRYQLDVDWPFARSVARVND